MTYLLDTNVCVQYLRGRNLPVLQRLQMTPMQDVQVCSVVKAELYLGALRSAKPAQNRANVDAFLRPYLSLAFDDAAAEVHALIRHQLETAGTPIGPHDLQIAAIALTNGLTLVTHNTAEFSRVPGLVIEDWEQP
jgi:tRNA(fMet)-specific endonuclease VapC